ncbi:hypothetical protein [Nocardia sp. NPDC047038]|uniref:ATP dependent DNA ligase n=1 Tax=Nocardia sp. NPDC047038 TaxID=3154338 RepID=UPI0033D169A9
MSRFQGGWRPELVVGSEVRAEIFSLKERLKVLTTTDSPFDQSAPSWPMTAARWVKPQLVGTVEYREFIGALRHPSWRGLRVEIDPSGVRLPTRDGTSPGLEAVMAGLAVSTSPSRMDGHVSRLCRLPCGADHT